MKEIIENTDTFGLSDVYRNFFLEKFYSPENYNELKSFYSDSPYIDLERTNLDPFSKKRKLYRYMPIYNKNNKFREGYIIVSAGIDGKINNNLQDTLYFEDVNILKFYNSVVQCNTFPFVDYSVKFNLFNYFFGKRDLLISYVNCIEQHEELSFKLLYSPTQLSEYMNKSKRLNCFVKGQLYGYDTLLNTLLLRDSEWSIICSMYNGRTWDITKDSAIVLGLTDIIDTKNKKIYLQNCLLVSDTVKFNK
jgi:hypothetical protein